MFVVSESSSAAQEKSYVAALAEVTPAESARGNKCILVVDDDAINQAMAKEFLEKRGYVIEAAGNGAVALERLAQHQFDLVLMDMRMPVMDGCTAAAEIRRREGNGWHVPIVALTACAGPRDREKCLNAGMNDYVLKPVLWKGLEAALDHWLRLHPSPAASREARATSTSAQSWDRGGREVLDKEILANLERLEAVYRTEFIAELIKLFLGHSPWHLTSLRTALSRRDASGVAGAAHLLKSGSSQLGATPLAELCEAMELHAESGTLEPCVSLMPRLDNEFHCVYKALQTRLEIKGCPGCP